MVENFEQRQRTIISILFGMHESLRLWQMICSVMAFVCSGKDPLCTNVDVNTLCATLHTTKNPRPFHAKNQPFTQTTTIQSRSCDVNVSIGLPTAKFPEITLVRLLSNIFFVEWEHHFHEIIQDAPDWRSFLYPIPQRIQGDTWSEYQSYQFSCNLE